MRLQFVGALTHAQVREGGAALPVGAGGQFARVRARHGQRHVDVGLGEVRGIDRRDGKGLGGAGQLRGDSPVFEQSEEILANGKFPRSGAGDFGDARDAGKVDGRP